MASCKDCKHHEPWPDIEEAGFVEIEPECKFDIEDQAYMEALFDEFEACENGDMDEFFGRSCKHYEARV
jgi:hypothetical protein